MWTVHRAVFDEHIANAATHFTTQYHAAVAVLHLTIANNYVFTRHANSPTIRVAPRFDGNAVIASVEVTFFDQHVLTTLGIAPIVVGAMRIDMYATHRDVFA